MSKETNEKGLGEITKNRAIKIFKALGFNTAEKWDLARLKKKVASLGTLIEGATLDDKTQKRVNAILRAQEAGRTVQVIDPENAVADKQAMKEVEAAAERERERKAEKKAQKNKKEKKVTKREKKEKEKTAKKTVKKSKKKTEKKTVEKAVKKTMDTKEKKLGVIMSMLEFVKTYGPISEKKIHSLLKKRFPDKNPDSMGRSIPKIPSHLRRTKNLDIIGKDDKGRYYIKK